MCVAVGGLYYPLGGAVWTLRLETGSRVCRETTRTGRPRLVRAVFLSYLILSYHLLRSTPSARADRQEPLPMFRCPGSPGFP